MFYLLSKLSLSLFFALATLLSIFNHNSKGQDLSHELFNAVLGMLGLIALVLISSLSINKRRTVVILILPIITFFTNNQMTTSFLSIEDMNLGFTYTGSWIENIITSYVYFLPSVLFLIIYKHAFLSASDKLVGNKIPEVVVSVVQSIVLLVPSLFVLSNVFFIDLTHILATSGVLAAVIGLAIQPNLSNVLSGIFVSFERPFNREEWVTIDEKTGIVLDVNWRSTKIRTFENTEITIPNEVVAKSILVNWSRNDQKFMSEGFHIFNTMSFHPRHNPEFISSLLHNALKKVKPIDGREKLDLQWVKFIEVNEFGLKFAVAFDCTNRLLKNSQQNVVLTEIHKTLAHAGISMTAGRLNTNIVEDTGLNALNNNIRQEDHYDPHAKDISNPYNETIRNKVLLQKVPIFSPMSDEEIDMISENCQRILFKENEIICHQNSLGDSLFIVIDGVMSVDLVNEDGKTIHLAKLGVGDFFGEMSLMTGETRSATVSALTNSVLLEISKAVMKDLFRNNVDFYDAVSKIFAQRQNASNLLSQSKSFTQIDENDLASKFKQAILSFFK